MCGEPFFCLWWSEPKSDALNFLVEEQQQQEDYFGHRHGRGAKKNPAKKSLELEKVKIFFACLVSD